jgi:hypothetical protein
MPEKKLKKVCQCENCGNEAEMVITCTLDDKAEPSDAEPQSRPDPQKHQVKGHGVCSRCGNEADMWIDLES